MNATLMPSAPMIMRTINGNTVGKAALRRRTSPRRVSTPPRSSILFRRLYLTIEQERRDRRSKAVLIELRGGRGYPDAPVVDDLDGCHNAIVITNLVADE